MLSLYYSYRHLSRSILSNSQIISYPFVLMCHPFIEIESQYHFTLLPPIGKPARTRTGSDCPASLPRLPRFANLAPPPGQPLPVCVQSRSGWRASEQTCMTTTESNSVAPNPHPRFALKNPHDHATGKRGGGGAPSRALFSYNSSHPPTFFSA